MNADRIRALARWVKRVGYVCALVGVGYLVWAYDLEAIPEDFPHLAPQKMAGGTKVVTTPVREGLHFGVGSVVVYHGGGPKEALCYGVIAGLPGDDVVLVEDPETPVAMLVGGREESLELPEGHRIPAGKIPDDHFLILLGDRHFVTTTLFPDSRQLGLIPRKWLEKKIVVPLAFL